MRRCSKTACSRAAVATLTYNYAEQTAVLGPLATYAEPHTYDLCATHGMRLTVPRGWEVIRLIGELVERDETDDLLAVADAVSERPRERGSRPSAEPAMWPQRQSARPVNLRDPSSRHHWVAHSCVFCATTDAGRRSASLGRVPALFGPAYD